MPMCAVKNLIKMLWTMPLLIKMKTIYYVVKLTFTISMSRSCSKIKLILKNKKKFKVENFKDCMGFTFC